MHKSISIEQYIAALPDGRQKALCALRDTIVANLPRGFAEDIRSDMIEYVVPHEIYPDGHFQDSSLPLPFVNLASHKHFIALYHMGLYSHDELFAWFSEQYPKHALEQADIGTSCIRFRNMDKIPYDLIGQLMSKISVEAWVRAYQEQVIPLYKAK